VPPTPDDPGGVYPFQITDHLKALIPILLKEQQISIMKSRQIYISTTLASYRLWSAKFHYGSTTELFSAGEKEAIELLGKAYRIEKLLPHFLKMRPKPDSQEEMGFPIIGSSIKAFPSTESAGISFTASCIITDEHEEHEYAEANYVSAKPAIDTIGGQFISVYTPKKSKPFSLAKSLFRNGTIYSFDPTLNKLIPEEEGAWGSGNNGFVCLFFPYNIVEGRDEEWYEIKKKSLSANQLQGLTPELYMESNYPRSIAEALSVPGTTVVFDRNVLNTMKDDCRSPINIGDDKELLRQHWGDIDSEICHIYKDYHIGNFYIAGTDVSLGVGKDYNVTVILDIKTGEIVADILSQHLAPEELAFHSVKLLERYHNPLWWIEQNLWGRTVIRKALQLGYSRLGYRGEKSLLPPILMLILVNLDL
jgi:hypothetical protein